MNNESIDRQRLIETLRDASTDAVLRDWDAGDEESAASHGDASTSAGEGLSEADREQLLHWLHGGASGGIQSLWYYVERIVADREAKARAEVWDEGFAAADQHSEDVQFGDDAGVPANPYRAEADK